MTQTKLSQGDLMRPLLHALLSLGGFSPYVAVVESAISTLNLTMDCMGEGPDGRPRVYVPASNAGWHLRARKLIVNEGRNWRLTDLGRQVALGEAEMPPSPPQIPKSKKSPGTTASADVSTETETVSEGSPEVHAQESQTPQASHPAVVSVGVLAPEAETAKIAETTPVVPVLQSAPPEPKTGTLRKVVMSDVGSEDWVSDAYLRSVVSANTACYGSWSPTAPVCGTCPIAKFCRQAQASALSVLASALVKSDAEKITPAVARLHDAVSASLSPASARQDPSPESGRKMIANFAGICSLSGATIEAGQECVYMPGVGLVTTSAYEKHLQGASA